MSSNNNSQRISVPTIQKQRVVTHSSLTLIPTVWKKGGGGGGGLRLVSKSVISILGPERATATSDNTREGWGILLNDITDKG